MELGASVGKQIDHVLQARAWLLAFDGDDSQLQESRRSAQECFDNVTES